MQPYANSSGQSNVLRYEIGSDYIVVEFAAGDERFYKYTYARTGEYNVDRMKDLAEAGQGLNTYINTHVKYLYESKW